MRPSFNLESVSPAFNYIELRGSVERNNAALNTIDRVKNNYSLISLSTAGRFHITKIS